MATSRNKIITIAVLILVLVINGIGAILKILKFPAVVDDFSKLGVGQYTQILGIVELILLSLFLYRKTMRIGFMLLCGYFGGAMATHHSHNQMFLQPAVPLLLICLSVFLRDRTIFYPTANHTA